MALSGVRIFMFNFEILQQRVHDNPGMYGFTSATACEAGNNNGTSVPNVTLNVVGCFYENSVHPPPPRWR